MNHHRRERFQKYGIIRAETYESDLVHTTSRHSLVGGKINFIFMRIFCERHVALTPPYTCVCVCVHVISQHTWPDFP